MTKQHSCASRASRSTTRNRTGVDWACRFGLDDCYCCSRCLVRTRGHRRGCMSTAAISSFHCVQFIFPACTSLQSLREYLTFCVFEPYFAKEREYGDQERDSRRGAER